MVIPKLADVQIRHFWKYKMAGPPFYDKRQVRISGIVRDVETKFGMQKWRHSKPYMTSIRAYHFRSNLVRRQPLSFHNKSKESPLPLTDPRYAGAQCMLNIPYRINGNQTIFNTRPSCWIQISTVGVINSCPTTLRSL